MVKVYPVESKKQFQLFEQVPEKILPTEKYYVPPFPGSISKMFKPDAAYAKYCEFYPFIAEKDGKIAGRITAIVNHRYNDYHKDKTGFFGFFDSIPDPDVVDALFSTAEKILRDKGLSSMRGPYNPTSNDEIGVLADGFDTIPMVMMPYNPPYYLDLYKNAGFSGARDLYAYYISAKEVPPERIEKIANRVRRSTGITVRPIDMKKLDREMKIIKVIYNETLNSNWGFLPISDEDVEFAANDLKAIADPSLFLIAEKDGVPVGFSMVLANINEPMWKAKNSKGIFRILRFLLNWKFLSPPTEARLIVLGVRPEYRGKGVAALFYYETLVVGKRRFKGGELSWVDEENQEIIKAIELMGGRKYKTYRLFERPIH